MRLPVSLWIVLALFLGLAVTFSAKTPFRQPGLINYSLNPRAAFNGPDIGAPDALQHANYIAYLKTNGKFPVLDPKQPDFSVGPLADQPAVPIGTGVPSFLGTIP